MSDMTKVLDTWKTVLDLYGVDIWCMSTASYERAYTQAVRDNVLSYSENRMLRDCGISLYKLTELVQRRHTGLPIN